MSELRTNRIVPRDGLPSGSSGGIIQVKSTTLTVPKQFNSQSAGNFTDVDGLSVSITPHRSDSKILLMCNISAGLNSTHGYNFYWRILRGSTPICVATEGGGVGATGGFNRYISDASVGFLGCMANTFLDSPATTSATTYKIQATGNDTGAVVYINRRAANNDYNMTSSITAMEVSG